MASAINVGSINLPKMMRHIAHRSSQVRDLVFVRDAIFDKDSKSTGQSNLTEGSGSTLAGPAVNFGYELPDSDYDVGVSRMMTLPGLTMLQSPIVSRSGQLERGGHRITGACTFYSPSLQHIRSQNAIFAGYRFGELETYDKLFDIETIIQNPNPDDFVEAIVGPDEDGDYFFTYTFTFAPTTLQKYRPGYQVDRLQFKFRTIGDGTTRQLQHFELVGKQLAMGGVSGTYYPKLRYSGGPPPSSSFYTVDVPLRIDKTIAANYDYIHYIEYVRESDGAPIQASLNAEKTGYNGVDFDLDLLDPEQGLHEFNIKFQMDTGISADLGFEIKDVYLYKEAEWRIQSIKDYRDEYMQIAAVRVRGERASRRRAYG